MRWSGQQLTSENPDALPGLARVSNLVRPVTTPEFAGMRFHEVLAKSALNRVPSQSAMPFGWTINPYRGCSHACVYCLAAETLVLMADGAQKPIWDVRVGDAIIGTRVEGRYRRYVETTVLAHWSTRKTAWRVHLEDGTTIVASGDHRFLTERGWKHVTGAGSGADVRPHLTTNNSLMGFGLAGAPDTIAGSAVKSDARLRVIRIEPLDREEDMFDITTGTGDFIANGVVSHNCFARQTHEYLDLDAGRDFDSEIIVKVNVGEVLRKELSKPSWTHEPVALGTNTDPYQRAEGRYALMPGIITALAESGTPFSILTKGTLLRRDLPLIAKAAELVPMQLAMSIAVFDDELQQSIEPGTPSTRARLETVRAARDLGLDCAVFMMPILPHLTDAPEKLEDAVSRVRDAGATSVLYSALHLRPGAREWFATWLRREHPGLVEKYRALYGDRTTAPKEYRRELGRRMAALVRRYGLELTEESDDLRSRSLRATAGVPSLSTVGGQPTLF